MGSDHSKTTAVTAEKFQYGPKQVKTRQDYPNSSANVQQPKSYSAAPPPYDAVNPISSVAFNSTASSSVQQAPKKAVSLSQISKPPSLPQQPNCAVCRGCHATANCPIQAKYENNPFPAGRPYQSQIPSPIPIQPQSGKNPYKWTSEQQLQQVQNENINMENSSAIHKQYKKPPPKSTPSPSYELGKNPFVWVNKRLPAVPSTKNAKVIDLNQELSKIYERIKENKLPNFQDFNKHLQKNKPLGNIRNHLVNNKYMSDVQFIIGGSPFYGHKVFLITSSFLFYDHFYVNDEKEMVIDSIDFETFQKLIAYCYTDEIKVNEDNVLELLLAANKLQVRQVTNVCHGFISNFMNPNSVFIILEKALELDNKMFEKKCLDYININEEKCFTSNGFYSVSLGSLMKILKACQYSSEKIERITEKYMTGSMEASSKASSEVPLAPDQQKNVQTPMQQPPKQVKAPQQPPKGVQQPQKQKGAIKKSPGKNKNSPKIPSLPIPSPNTGPPFVSPFPYPPPLMQHPTRHMGPPTRSMGPQTRSIGPQTRSIGPQTRSIGPQTRSMAPPYAVFHNSYQNISNTNGRPLINFDDDDDASSIISKDDDNQSKMKVNVIGSRHKWNTEFSRLDFVCKRSMLLHSIWFSEDLAKSCTAVECTVGVFENNQRNDIHKRAIKINNGMKLRFMRFAREPLKIYVGQKFFIKLNFSGAAPRMNVNADGLSSNNMIELRKDPEVKKYFNIITSVEVTEMP